MSNYNFTNGLGALGIVMGIGGLLFAGWQAKKQNELEEKIGIAMKDLENKTPVEIKEEMVSKAIRNAVDREVRNAVNDTVKSVKADIHKEVETEVRKEVNASFQTIKAETAEKISNQVALIDEGALKAEVTKKAEDKILKKFDGSLDNVLNEARDECKRRLNSVTKSWESIADWAETLLPRRNNNSGMTFRIGD